MASQTVLAADPAISREDEVLLKAYLVAKQKNKRRMLIISVLSVVIFLAVWQLVTDGLRLFPAQALPSPLKVAQSFVAKLTEVAPDNGTLFTHIISSLQVALSGYLIGALVGIPLGILTAWWRRADLIVTPLFDMIRPIPTIAWIPLMILWFGIGLGAKAAIVFMSAFVPCVINTYSGIKATSQVHKWVAETFGASRRQMLMTIAIPTALPYIFTGLRISLGAAWTSLAAAEMLASSSGLGFMIQINRTLARPDLILVGMLTIGAVGALLSVLLGLLERRVVKGVKRDA